MTATDKPENNDKNPRVKCNALSKNENNVNILLRPSEAIQLARNILQKAQEIIEKQQYDLAVHLWNIGKTNETLYCGAKKKARIGGRRN